MKCCRGTQRPRYDYKSLKELTHKHKVETDTRKRLWSKVELHSKQRTDKDFKEEMECIVPKGHTRTTQRWVVLKGAERRSLLKGTELPEEFFQISHFHTLFPFFIISLHKAVLLVESHGSKGRGCCAIFLRYRGAEKMLTSGYR